MKTSYIQNATVLVIDDNPINLDVLCNYLSNMGAKVLIKKDGESGINCAIKQQPDIILLDIIMPTIDGYETCRRLKLEQNTRAIPVIFTSALAETIDKLKGFTVGGVDYITKPFQEEEVFARIETHLNLIRLRQQLEIQNKQLQQEIEIRKLIEKDLNLAKKSLEKANNQLQKLATSDGLTQIANRRYFDSYIEQEWQRAIREKQYLAFILCDIDYFKLYNDTYGHQAGDSCLKQVAQTLEQLLKRPADLVARYGGEEFGIILPNTQFSGAIGISKEICKAIQELKIPHEKSSAASYITLSLGINYILPTVENDMAEFIEIADKALYQAKKQGRNQFITSDQL